MDEFMRQALREVDAIGWSAPSVAPPLTKEELERIETMLDAAQMRQRIEAVRREVGEDPYQQAAA